MEKIKIADLRRFVKTEVMPRFSKEWSFSDASLVRISGYSMQKLIFSEFSQRLQYRVYYSVQSLAIPGLHKDEIGIGKTLKHKPEKLLGGLFQKKPKEAWFEWGARFEDIDYIMQLISQQVEPEVNRPLTTESVYNFLHKNYIVTGDTDQYVLWTAGIVLSELGRFNEAQQLLSKTVEFYDSFLKQSAKLLKTKNLPEDAYLRDITKREQAQETLKVLINASTFRNYCDKVVAKNIHTLKIPPYQEP